MTLPPDRPDPAPTLLPVASLGLVLVGGVALGAAWARLPAPVWGLAALLLLAAAAAALRALRVALAGGAAAALRHDLDQLQRRSRQFALAEQLVAVGSYDWRPGSGELHWSPQHFRLWGYEPGSVVPGFDVYRRHLHPDDAERVLATLDQALQGRATYDCRHRVRRGDGSVRHVHARGEVFFDRQGRAERMIGAVLDITDRVEAEASLRMHAFVLDAITDTVSVVDADAKYRLANASWYRQRGYEQGRATTPRFDQLRPFVVDPARLRAFDACLAEERVQVVRGPTSVPDAAGRITETRYFPFSDPEVDWRGVVMVTRDVSEDEALRQRLRDSVDNLSLTLNSIGDAIFATTASSVEAPVLFANEQLRRMWQIPPEVQPLTARHIMEYSRRFHADPDAVRARILSIIASREPAEDRLELIDGRVLVRRCIPTAREDRELRVWLYRDITDETRARRAQDAAEARQRALLEAFPGYISILDADLVLLYVNARVAALHGTTPEQLRGRCLGDLLSPERMRAVQAAQQRVLAGETVVHERHFDATADRESMDHLITMVPGHAADGQPLCFSFGIDITPLKRAEAALLAAKDEAERANEAKSRFLSAMSHELRTPLNAVIGFSQLLEHNDDGNLNERQLRQLGEIRKAGAHLLALIDDLLDLARIEAGRIALMVAPVALDGLIDECLPLVQPLAQARGCVVVRPDPTSAEVMADRMRLKQVLLNLLSNAIKFNRPGGQVWLQVEAGGAQVCIAVRDEGPGLSAEAQARLFQPFERLDADHAGVAGTGIGLALSRQLVLAMQGDIDVQSQPGEGCTFRVHLPRAAPAAVTRVLYVDDNPVNLVLMAGLFEDWPGYSLVTVDHGEAALQQLRQAPADLMLVDLQMPGMDGFELFARLRADPATQALPVIAVSADATAATMARCRALGFADYVTKPVESGRLRAAIDAALPVPT